MSICILDANVRQEEVEDREAEGFTPHYDGFVGVHLLDRPENTTALVCLFWVTMLLDCIWGGALGHRQWDFGQTWRDCPCTCAAGHCGDGVDTLRCCNRLGMEP